VVYFPTVQVTKKRFLVLGFSVPFGTGAFFSFLTFQRFSDGVGYLLSNGFLWAGFFLPYWIALGGYGVWCLLFSFSFHHPFSPYGTLPSFIPVWFVCLFVCLRPISSSASASSSSPSHQTQPDPHPCSTGISMPIWAFVGAISFVLLGFGSRVKVGFRGGFFSLFPRLLVYSMVLLHSIQN